MKQLILVLTIALAGCASEPVPVVSLQTDRANRLDTGRAATLPFTSERYKIVSTALNEWRYFGRQIVLIEGDEESIPHVGIWEDQDDAHSKRINLYWRAAGWDEVYGKDCMQPWSAAFVSWVMQTAGVSRFVFPPAISHKTYLNYFLATAGNPYAGWAPHGLQDYKAQPGDLICANRDRSHPIDTGKQLPASVNARLHCDIVVATDGKTLEAVGGNVRNSVSKTVLTLSVDGYLKASKARDWFLIVENRLDR